jgi:hypothetical protein
LSGHAPRKGFISFSPYGLLFSLHLLDLAGNFSGYGAQFRTLESFRKSIPEVAAPNTPAKPRIRKSVFNTIRAPSRQYRRFYSLGPIRKK